MRKMRMAGVADNVLKKPGPTKIKHKLHTVKIKVIISDSE